MTPRTFEESGALQDLARTARNGCKDANKAIGSARQTGLQALSRVILTGDALNRAQAIVGAEEFPAWFKKHVAVKTNPIDFRMASVFMRLAEPEEVSMLSDPFAVCKAFADLGIVGGYNA
jgi:hypothetical protein